METSLMAMHSDVEIEVDLDVDGEEGGCENINVDESTMALLVTTNCSVYEIGGDGLCDNATAVISSSVGVELSHVEGAADNMVA